MAAKLVAGMAGACVADQMAAAMVAARKVMAVTRAAEVIEGAVAVGAVGVVLCLVGTAVEAWVMETEVG